MRLVYFNLKTIITLFIEYYNMLEVHLAAGVRDFNNPSKVKFNFQ